MQQHITSTTPLIANEKFDPYPQNTIIPKILHYCWFGEKEKPELIKQCMTTWEKVLPDYRIIEWNESNFDINICQYTKDTYRSKKYAYLTDYVRLWCLYTMGGIYVDADVQIVKSFDRFLKYRCFTGHETDNLLLAAVLGAEKNHPWIKYLLDHYADKKFNPNYLVPNTQIVTALSNQFIKRQNYGFTYLKDDVVIFPITYFAGFNHQELKPIITEDTYSIHHFCGSWTNRKSSDRSILGGDNYL